MKEPGVQNARPLLLHNLLPSTACKVKLPQTAAYTRLTPPKQFFLKWRTKGGNSNPCSRRAISLEVTNSTSFSGLRFALMSGRSEVGLGDTEPTE